ncbi:MAG: glycine cleavage system protein GcvH [Pseudomonadota bacterium]|nr:glycine cleavage system protein GcvH [Pseudomonadota bacterium]
MAATRFTKEHEWIRTDAAAGVEATCGISDYAQKALGDIVYVELPPLGKQVKQGESVAVVESAKAASEVYAPVDGEVIAVNDKLSSDPAKVNTSPAGDGWFFKLRISGPAQLDALMDEAAYEKHIKGLLGS